MSIMVPQTFIRVALLSAALAWMSASQAGAQDNTPRPISQTKTVTQPANAIDGGEKYNGDIPTWIAYLMVGERSCTAQFLSKTYVLTARHCVYNDDGEILNNISVNFKKNNDTEFVLTKWASASVVQDFLQDGNKDIALLRLGSEFPYPISAAPLYHGYQFINPQIGIVLGYGVTPNENQDTENIHNYLYWGTINIKWNYAFDAYNGDAYYSVMPDDPESKNPKGANSTFGDSGGPLTVETPGDGPLSRVGRLVGIFSLTSRVTSQHSNIDDNVISEIGPYVDGTLSSPVEGQSFLKSNDKITVTGYIPKALINTGYQPEVFMKKANEDETIPCDKILHSGSKWTCKISLKDERIGLGIYNIYSKRMDGTEDTVSINLIDNIIDNSVVYPASDGDTINGYDKNLPYTISGRGMPGANLKVILEIDNSDPQYSENLPGDNKNESPCLDSDNIGQGTVTVTPQGYWICSILPRNSDTEYAFKIFDEADTPHKIISRKYKLNIDYDELTFDEIPNEYNKTPPSRLTLTGKGERRSTIYINSTNKIGACQTKVDDNAEWECPPVVINSAYGKPTTFNATMRSDTTDMGVRNPEGQIVQHMNFAPADNVEFTDPDQANSETEPTISPLTFTLAGDAIGFNGIDFKISSINLLTGEESDQCRGTVEKDKWSCGDQITVDSGNYRLVLSLNPNNIGNRIQNNFVQAYDVFNFITPLQVDSSDEYTEVTIGMNVFKITSWADDDDTASVKFYASQGPDSLVEYLCKANKASNWSCNGELNKPGFTAIRAELNIEGFTEDEDITQYKATFVDVVANTAISSPANNSTTADFAVPVSGRGDPGNRIEVSQTRYPGDPNPFSCDVTVNRFGDWQCPQPLPVPDDGQYTLTAKEVVADQNVNTVTTIFTVSKTVDNGQSVDSCPDGYADIDGVCTGQPVSRTDSNSGSTGIGTDDSSGSCPTAFTVKSRKCSGPYTSGPGGGSGLPIGRYCPAGYSYNTGTRDCTGSVASTDFCPSGYQYNAARTQCNGPASGGADFRILLPINKQHWDCGGVCQVNGQVPEGDTAKITIIDTVSRQPIGEPYLSSVYANTASLWQVTPTKLTSDASHTIIATRMHNGQEVPGVEATQQVIVTVPEKLGSVILDQNVWPATINIPAPVTATVLDGDGEPVADAAVIFSADNGATVVATPPLTDAYGKTQAMITKNAGGTTTVTGVIDTKSSSTRVNFMPAAASIWIDKAIPPVNIDTPTTVIATALDKDGKGLPGVTVRFSADNSAKMSPSTTITDRHGIATTQIIDSKLGATTVTATTADVSDTTTIIFVPKINSISLEPQSGSGDVGSPYPVTATVIGSNGQPMESVSVVFSVDKDGTMSPLSTDTDEHGKAISNVITTQAGASTITAKAEGISGSTTLNFAPVVKTVSFPLNISAIAAPGDTPITALVMGSDNKPMSGVPVVFSVDDSSASITPVSKVTRDDGTFDGTLSVGEAFRDQPLLKVTATANDISGDTELKRRTIMGAFINGPEAGIKWVGSLYPINIYVFSQKYLPVAGVGVSFTVDSDASLQVSGKTGSGPLIGVTNEDGEINAYVTKPTSGVANIMVTVIGSKSVTKSVSFAE